MYANKKSRTIMCISILSMGYTPAKAETSHLQDELQYALKATRAGVTLNSSLLSQNDLTKSHYSSEDLPAAKSQWQVAAARAAIFGAQAMQNYISRGGGPTDVYAQSKSNYEKDQQRRQEEAARQDQGQSNGGQERSRSDGGNGHGGGCPGHGPRK